MTNTTQQINTAPEPTMFKTFSGISELLEKTTKHSIFIRLSNGWFTKVTKANLKKTAQSMSKSNEPFTGEISFASGGHKWAQVTING